MASRVWCDQRLRTAVASLSRLRVCSLKTRTSNEDNFEELLRKSSFVRLGRPRGKSVQGKVTHVVAAGEERDDLYVDFGWKFHAVVNQKRRSDVGVGSLVTLKIENLEETGHFLGQSRRITLCEADARIIN